MGKRQRRLVACLSALMASLFGLGYGGPVSAVSSCNDTGTCESTCNGDCSVYGANCQLECDEDLCTSGYYVYCQEFN